MKYNKEKFKKLGKNSTLLLKPDKSILDKHPNPHKDTEYCIRFTCPEFTSICPVTSQPDFAKLIIDYIPIGKDLDNLLKPNWLRIAGIWYPRGGIPIDIFWQTKVMPKGCLVPELNFSPYRGRD